MGSPEAPSIVSLSIIMKVLGFAKVASQHIASYVLIISTILEDITSFMTVLSVIIAMSGTLRRGWVRLR